MRPPPRPEILREFLTEEETIEIAARAATVAGMSRLDRIRFGFAPLARAVRKRLAYWSAWFRSGSLPNSG